MRPGQGYRRYMFGMADAGGNYLAVEVVQVDYINNITDQFYTGMADIIEPADKRADISGARPCGQ